MTTHDVIVLGVGGMGSATCWALAKRGVKVVGIEQHTIGHALGSSHGATRLIRQAYFEHPDYVPLLKSAYGLWDELCREAQAALFHRIGLVIFGKADGPIISGVRASAAHHAIPIHETTAGAATSVHAAFSPPPDFVAILEPGAGYLEVENCVRAMTRCAIARGAEIRAEERVLGIDESAGCVTVRTVKGVFSAAHLIVTAGPWTERFVPCLAPRLAVSRVPLHWFQTTSNYASAGMPCFGFELDDGFYYGLPPLDARGVKVGKHAPGDKVSDPSDVDRTLDQIEFANVQRFVASCLPGVDAARASDRAVCLYTMTPDTHFILDRSGRISVGAGFSGHGFKFAPIIGSVLADLALDGGTKHPIEFLRERWSVA